MRQLKQFMRNRKKEMLACGPCECRTLQCWRYANENCGCGDISTGDMVQYVLNWFQSTPVFADLTPEQQEQALQDAQTILEGAGEGIAPFYQAVQQGRTFANYVEQLGLTVDETGPCDSSLYEDNEAFIVYISAAGAIDCKYLALVATRGLTPSKELANKDEIAAYFDWLTTSDVTYTFEDWDGEILKVGTVEKGKTPVAPSAPTRAGYRFIGWTPAVAAVTEDVTYVATYVEQFDVTIASNDTDYGTVNVSELTVDKGMAISAEGNVLTIGTTNITATPAEGYQFSSWGELPATVTEDLSITATFEALAIVTFSSKCIDNDTGEEVVGGPMATFSQNSITVPVDTTIEPIWSGVVGESAIIGVSFSTGDSVTWTAPALADGYGYYAEDPTASGDIETDQETGITTVKGDGDMEVDAWRWSVALITIESNDESKGTVDIESIYGIVGSHIEDSDNTLSINGFIDNQPNSYTVTATPIEGATFKEWQGLPEGDIEGPITITAVFEAGR